MNNTNNNNPFNEFELRGLTNLDKIVRPIIKILKDRTNSKKCNFEPKAFSNEIIDTLPEFTRDMMTICCKEEILSVFIKEEENIKSLCIKGKTEKNEFRKKSLDIVKKIMESIPKVFSPEQVKLLEKYYKYRQYIKQSRKQKNKSRTSSKSRSRSKSMSKTKPITIKQ